MDIKGAVAYAQIAFKQLLKENKKELDEHTAKQLGDLMWLAYYSFDEPEALKKAKKITDKLELVENDKGSNNTNA